MGYDTEERVHINKECISFSIGQSDWYTLSFKRLKLTVSYISNET